MGEWALCPIGRFWVQVLRASADGQRGLGTDPSETGALLPGAAPAPAAAPPPPAGPPPPPPARSLPPWARGTFHSFRGRPWPEPQPEPKPSWAGVAAAATRGRG